MDKATEDSKAQFYSRDYYKGYSPEPRLIKVNAEFSKYKGERLLDVGCGDGEITLQIKKSMSAKEAYGLELSHEAVANAVKKGINAIQLDIDNDPFPFTDNFFDAVYCGEIIEHVFDPDRLLSEVSRVLKKGGICVMSTPNLAGWSSRIALLFGYQPYPMAASPNHESAGKLAIKGTQGQWGHIRVLTLTAFKELVSLNGFEILKVLGCTVTVKGKDSLFLRVISSLDTIMSKSPSLSTRIILILKKI